MTQSRTLLCNKEYIYNIYTYIHTYTEANCLRYILPNASRVLGGSITSSSIIKGLVLGLEAVRVSRKHKAEVGPYTQKWIKGDEILQAYTPTLQPSPESTALINSPW